MLFQHCVRETRIRNQTLSAILHLSCTTETRLQNQIPVPCVHEDLIAQVNKCIPVQCYTKLYNSTILCLQSTDHRVWGSTNLSSVTPNYTSCQPVSLEYTSHSLEQCTSGQHCRTCPTSDDEPLDQDPHHCRCTLGWKNDNNNMHSHKTSCKLTKAIRKNGQKCEVQREHLLGLYLRI